MENPKSPFTIAKYIYTELQSGKSKQFVQRHLNISRDYLNKHLWLNSWPEECVKICTLYSDIFTPRVIFNVFASRKTFFSEEDFFQLKKEITEYVKIGAKHKPRKAVSYPKSRAGGSLETQRIRQEVNIKSSDEETGEKGCNFNFDTLLQYQKLFKDILGLDVVVQYSNTQQAGEVRIHFKREKDLEYLMDRMN